MSTTTAKAIGTFHPIPLRPLDIDCRKPFSVLTMSPTKFGFEGDAAEGYPYVADTKYWRFEPAEEAPAVQSGAMNRASPAALRQALEAASTYAKSGIMFVPMPVLDDADASALWIQVAKRFEKMTQDAEKVGP